MTGPERDSGQNGFALFVVLMFLVLAASIATPFFATARDYAFILRNGVQESRSQPVADGILALSAQRYFELAAAQKRLPMQVTCALGENGQSLLVSFQNHAGLIDLNAATAPLLKLGFRALGADTAAAAQLAALAESYRAADPANNRADDAGTAVVGGLKKAPFESTAELLDFRLPAGATADMLGNVFTVHTRIDALDERFASRPLRKALGATSPGGGPASANADAPPVQALTVEAYFVTGNGRRVRSTATYALREDMAIKRFGPAATGRFDALPVVNPKQMPPVACPKFYDERSMPVLVELVR